jgi:hypothetical protein
MPTGCLRVLGAEGPRQAVNAITLWSVMQANIIPTGAHQAAQGHSPIIQFFLNIKALADENRTQAIILSSMTFTLFIWVISMILLILALLFYVFFLWGYIRNETLTGFCRRKVETRLARIVKAKTDKIWERQRKKEEELANKGSKKGGSAHPGFGDLARAPTLPVFEDDGLPLKSSASFMSKAESEATLPRYTSQPTTPADDYPSRKPSLSSFRTASTGQQSTNGSLLGNAAPMGMSQAPISRPGTAHSNRSYSSMRSNAPSVPPLRTPSNGPGFGPPPARASPLSSTTPASANSAPWRTHIAPLNEDAQEYEMQDGPSLPSALRPALGRRDASLPATSHSHNHTNGNGRGPLPYPPSRSFTAPIGNGASAPRSATPGSGMYGRSQTPGAGMGLPRSMTPGAAPPRLGPPGAGLSANMPPRYATPGAPMQRPPPDPGLGGW